MSDIVPRSPMPPLTTQSTLPQAVGALMVGPKGELAKGLAQAINTCHAVEKRDRNEWHKYAYASAETIIEEGRKALAGAGLALIPIEASLNGSEREGADRFELVRTFLLVHSSGESAPLRVAWPVVPDKGRPLDKATAAADTLSLSYLLRDLLLMPRVDPSDDVNARDDRPREQHPERRERPRKEKKAPSLPTDGKDLVDKLHRREAELVEKGLCRPGELLEAVWKAGKPLKYPEDLKEWAGDEAMRLATDAARTFVAHIGSAPSPGQLAALDTLIEQCGRTLPRGWKTLRQLPAVADKGLDLPATLDEITRKQYEVLLPMLEDTVRSDRQPAPAGVRA